MRCYRCCDEPISGWDEKTSCFADVEPDDFAESQPGAEGQGDDQVVAGVLGGGAEDEFLLVMG